MMDLAELNSLGRYNGGQIAPAGTFVNLRTLAYFQQASDGALNADGTYIMLSQTSNLSASQIATAVNALIGTSHVSGDFHARNSGDAVHEPGQMTNDA
jgi:hypothetical protein